MIIVTGTKRSGTSMWMQLLTAAGFPPIGNAFPRNWEKTIKDANPAGFYESELRQGIYFKTNPHPKTGTYLFPEQTQRHAVKVFVPGLIRTDRAFISKVIATIRPWRQYVASVRRLYAMEEESTKEQRDKKGIPPPNYLPPELEWWGENFSLMSDIVTRRYPFYMVAYESVVQAPETALPPIFEWLGEGDVSQAIAGVDPALRTQTPDAATGECGLAASVIEVYDRFYDVVKEKRELTQEFVNTLNETNEAVGPKLNEALRTLATAERERQAAIKAQAKKESKS